MKIIFIGSGNIATHLSNALKLSGHEILQVYSRTKSNAKRLAVNIGAEFTDDLGKLRSDADIFIIAVKDGVLPEIAAKVNVGKRLVVHTSGSMDMEVLKNTSVNYGVFYPLQSFSKKIKVDVSGVPILIEANKAGNERILFRLASAITGKKNIHRMNSAKRKTVHLAAVFVNNFSNHLYAIADELLKDKGVPFDILKPLIIETAKKIQHNPPLKMQTGPAKRGDRKIISEHLKMLESNPSYKKIYSLISKSISEAIPGT